MLTQSKIELNEQIIFSKDAGLFIGRITEVREKAVKVDYCMESIWNNCQLTIFTYSTWIPKAAIIPDKIGGLTVKKWFANIGLKAENVRHIKKYYIQNSEKVLI